MSNEIISDDIARLREEYEDSLFRYMMARYAEECGRELKTKNEELKASGQFAPTPGAIRRYNRALDGAFRKRRIVEFPKRVYRSLNKAAMFIVAAFVMLTATAMAVEPIRVEVLNFLISIQNEYTSLRLDTSKGNNLIGDNLYVSWTDGYVPTYIPEGYHIVNITNKENMKAILFENDDGQKIDYSEYSANIATNLDTENADTENIKVNGYDALLVLKDGMASIAWSDGQRMFVITSLLEKSELIRVAENVMYVK